MAAVGAEPPNDALIKLANDGAKAFVDAYYPALHSSRSTLSRFYTPTCAIAWNGNTLTGGDAFEAFYKTMPSTHLEVQSYDAHPVPLPPDPSTTTQAAGIGAITEPTMCNILLMTSGYAKFGDERNAPHRGFSESVLLVPDPAVPNGFLVGQQSFRLVV